MQYVLSMACLHMNHKAHMACNFNCLVEIGLLKMIGSRIHCKYSYILETVQDRVAVI